MVVVVVVVVGGRGRHLGEGAGHLAHLFLEQLARLQGDIGRYREIQGDIGR